MFLIIDRDNIVGIYRSVAEAEANLETIDVELGEYEFCDETGQRYVGEVLETVEKFRRGAFRLIPRGTPDSALPKTFLSRAVQCHSKLPGVRTLQEARAYFGTQPA
ncbi:MAG TPA: hypothetical protein VJU77_09010 [Chthoniobacterales bacterium]|nr:hypothetical protein [Chthoniobacterales bacterium]